MHQEDRAGNQDPIKGEKQSTKTSTISFTKELLFSLFSNYQHQYVGKADVHFGKKQTA